ncbi:MAG: hypothetical protein K2X50_06775 [Gammaproteobacteria bacterium]|nr:hypothetical protein [Gammaproteobacteria bacterium]
MHSIKIRIPIINFDKIRAARANRELTRRMRTLLSGLESPYRRIDWTSDDGSIQSQTLPTEVATIVQNVLSEAGLKCTLNASSEEGRSTITINCSPNELNVQDILSEHRKKILSSVVLSQDETLIKELVDSVSTAWEKLSKPSEDAFNILRDAPPIVIQLAEKIDELFIGMKSSTTKKTTSETAVLSSVHYTNLFINLMMKASPDLFRFVFKKTPLGPIFIAGYQIADDVFYSKKWIAGRKKHQKALFSTGMQIQLFSEMYDSLSKILTDRIESKINQLRGYTNLNDQQITDLIDNNQTELLDSTSDEAKTLYSEIIELKNSLINAEKSTKELTTELRKKASRLNTAQQVMMTTKHIDRIFNLAFIAFGIGAFFFPPLAIPAIIIGVGKSITRKRLEDRIRTATQIVQGIYDIDSNIVLTKGENKAAVDRSQDLKKMTLQYAPVAVVGIKLGLTQKRSFDRTKNKIRSNPEYTLYIAETFSYKELDVKSTRGTIRGQIDAYSFTCRHLIFHLGIIQGRDLNGNLPSAHPLHPPYIHNISELKDLINTWSENLIQQIHDQQLNPGYGKNSYFSGAQIRTIRELHSNAINYIESYQNRINALDRKEVDKDGNPIPLSHFDMDYAKSAHESILDEVHALRSIIDNKTRDQTVKNASVIIERLENRMNLLMNYCDKCPDQSHREMFNRWKDIYKIHILSLKKYTNPTTVKKTSSQKSPSEKLRGIEVQPSDNKQVFVTVHHPRGFESRTAMVNRLKEHISEQKQQAQKEQKTELVLLPVAKVSTKALFHYKGNFWKMMWLVRGIDRAIESVELTMKNKDTIGAEINPKNQLALLNFYKKQLNKIVAYRDAFTFSKSGQDIVFKHIDKAIKKVDALIEKTEHQISQLPNR